MNEQMVLDLDGIEPIIEQNRIEEQYCSLPEKIEKAKQILKLAAEMSKTYYGKPLIICHSGGKDSQVLLDIAEKCLENDEYELLYSHTTVDAPSTVKIIRSEFKRMEAKGVKTTIRYPMYKGRPITMWELIVEKQVPPVRMNRYCCQVLKESGTPNRMCATGVRSDESKNREGRDVFSLKNGNSQKFNFYSYEHAEEVHKESQEIQDENWDCTLIKSMKEHGEVVVNPIYWFTEREIWDYIKDNNIKVNILYSMGYKRCGCIGCPMASRKQMLKEFNDFPTYKKAYINAFDKMMKRRLENGKDDLSDKDGWHQWRTGEDVFNWWIREGLDNVYGQMNLFE